MTRRQRVMAALRGEHVDRVPLAFWMHNFATENSAKGLSGETLRLARTFDWDYLKPQSRAQGFAEMWGLEYRPSTERAVPFAVTRTPLASASDLGRLKPGGDAVAVLNLDQDPPQHVLPALAGQSPAPQMRQAKRRAARPGRFDKSG